MFSRRFLTGRQLCYLIFAISFTLNIQYSIADSEECYYEGTKKVSENCFGYGVELWRIITEGSREQCDSFNDGKVRSYYIEYRDECIIDDGTVFYANNLYRREQFNDYMYQYLVKEELIDEMRLNWNSLQEEKLLLKELLEKEQIILSILEELNSLGSPNRTVDFYVLIEAFETVSDEWFSDAYNDFIVLREELYNFTDDTQYASFLNLIKEYKFRRVDQDDVIFAQDDLLLFVKNFGSNFRELLYDKWPKMGNSNSRYESVLEIVSLEDFLEELLVKKDSGETKKDQTLRVLEDYLDTVRRHRNWITYSLPEILKEQLENRLYAMKEESLKQTIINFADFISRANNNQEVSDLVYELVENSIIEIGAILDDDFSPFLALRELHRFGAILRNIEANKNNIHVTEAALDSIESSLYKGFRFYNTYKTHIENLSEKSLGYYLEDRVIRSEPIEKLSLSNPCKNLVELIKLHGTSVRSEISYKEWMEQC